MGKLLVALGIATFIASLPAWVVLAYRSLNSLLRYANNLSKLQRPEGEAQANRRRVARDRPVWQSSRRKDV
jgi:hypothetical protein